MLLLLLLIKRNILTTHRDKCTEHEYILGQYVKARKATKLCIDVKYDVFNLIYVVKLTLYVLQNFEIFHVIILKM
jgi:hypothetical protein